MQTTLKKISDNIYYLPANHETDRPILAAIVGSERTLIVDAGNSTAHVELFFSELEKAGIKTVDYVAITHWHWDHVFGIAAMNKPTIAHVETRKEIEKMKSYDWSDEALNKRVEEGIEIPFCAEMIKKEFKNREDIKIALPDIIFEDKLAIDLGGVNCIIENVAGDHSIDSTIIYVVEDKVIFLGDCLAPDLYCKEWKYTNEKLSLLLEKIESYGADVYVESHLEPTKKAEFQRIIDEMRSIGDVVKSNNGKGDKMVVELKSRLNRDLNEDDHEMVNYFINGLGI